MTKKYKIIRVPRKVGNRTIQVRRKIRINPNSKEILEAQQKINKIKEIYRILETRLKYVLEHNLTKDSDYVKFLDEYVNRVMGKSIDQLHLKAVEYEYNVPNFSMETIG